MRHLHPSRVATHVVRDPALLLVIGAALALVLAASWIVAARIAPSVSAKPATATTIAVAHAAVPASRDEADETWHVVAPRSVPAPRLAAVEPAPDWSSLSLPVAAAAPVPAGTIGLAGAPSGLDVAMSARERRALIATAREPEGLPSPKGYRPGIAVIVPGGSMSDGVCR